MGLLSDIFGSGGGGNLADALREYDDITLPELKEINPELYQQVIQLNPELETSVNLGPSALEGVSTDPMLKQAQLEALRKLQTIGDGEQSVGERVQLTQVENDINRNLQGNQEAIMQNLAMRGMSGGGNELVARQMAAQSSANRQADLDMQIRAQAEQRALEALMQSGTLANQLETEEYNRKANLANRQDAISQFNAQNQQQVMARNAQQKNSTNQLNAQVKQNVANANVGARNNARNYNQNTRLQQNFNNQLNLANGRAGVNQAVADSKDQQVAGNRQFVGGLIQAGAMAFSDEKVKENVTRIDSAEFLKHLNGYEYDYKDEKFGSGDQVGIMAQDLEKVAPQAVSEDEAGVKRIDYSKMGGPIMALLADLDKRIKDIEGDDEI